MEENAKPIKRHLIPLSALGRNFNLGTLYKYTEDIILKGKIFISKNGYFVSA